MSSLRRYLSTLKVKLQKSYAAIRNDRFGWAPPENLNKYGKQPIINNAQQANDIILRKLEGDEPLMLARFGSTQMNVLANWIQIQDYKSSGPFGKLDHVLKGSASKFKKNWMDEMHIYGGFFPNTRESVLRYIKEFESVLPNIDIHGVWGLPMEDFACERYFPEADLLSLRFLEPFFCDNPWTSYLNGKRVLVIHPFAETIELQYQNNRAFLFKNPNILPEFELRTIKAVQSRGRNKVPFKTWFHAFDWMCGEMEKEPFDIAIIGAGSYGMRLAAHAKALGSHGFHLGGVTQILFGITGRRWEHNGNYKQLPNSFWTRASKQEQVGIFNKNEDASYW